MWPPVTVATPNGTGSGLTAGEGDFTEMESISFHCCAPALLHHCAPSSSLSNHVCVYAVGVFSLQPGAMKINLIDLMGLH